MRATLPRAACAFALVALLVCGCGGAAPKKIKVTGKFLKNGQPVTYTKDTYVTLIFTPVIPKQLGNVPSTIPANTYPAKVAAELGTYEAEMPAGKYRVNFFILEPGAAPGKAPPPNQTGEWGEIYELTDSRTLDLPVPGSEKKK